MPLITDSEMEDFDAAIVAAGFEVGDFNVLAPVRSGQGSEID